MGDAKEVEKRRRARRGDLFEAYLGRQPERDPRILLPRSVLPVARGAFLLRGVLAQGWSLGWLAAFFVAEFLLVARLAALGERFARGEESPSKRRRRSFAGELVWAVMALAATLFAGQALDRSTRGAWLGFGDGDGPWAWPSWGIVGYVALLVVDFVAEGIAARRERRTFVPAAVLQASLAFAIAILLSFFVIFLSGVASSLLGDQGVRGLVAIALVLARTGADLAVLWLPHWVPWMEARQNARRRG